jgi:hypothetical protein
MHIRHEGVKDDWAKTASHSRFLQPEKPDQPFIYIIQEPNMEQPQLEAIELEIPPEFAALCSEIGLAPVHVLHGFIADLCNLRVSPHITNGSDERMMAGQYFGRTYGESFDCPY